jgi:hypothetical protein
MLGSPGVSHLNIKSFLVALSSKATETVVAARRASLFLLRTTSAMVTQRAFQLFRCTARGRIWQMKLDVTSSCSAACHDRGSLEIRHARSQSWGCGTLPLRSLSSSRVACSVMHTGSSGLNQDASANLCPRDFSRHLMFSACRDRYRTLNPPNPPRRRVDVPRLRSPADRHSCEAQKTHPRAHASPRRADRSANQTMRRRGPAGAMHDPYVAVHFAPIK